MTFLNRMELGWWAGSGAVIGLGGVLSMLHQQMDIHLAFPPAYMGSLGYEDSTIGTAIRSTCWLECGGVQDESTCQKNVCLA